MTTKFNKIFNINGVIDPNQSVMSNLNTLCTASGCWLTFDVNTGQWAVIINKPSAVQHYFDDSNIIGAINVLGTGLNEFYNRVSVAFNHRDLDDKVDYIDMVIPAGEKFPNETENTLHMEFDCINDPIQAMYLGVVELKQSRLDKVVEFRTDYSAIGLKAGDLIAVTAEMYGFDEKQFRVVKITEEDADNGAILLSITGIEYSADIYNTSGILREERDLYNGIIPKAINTSIIYEDTQVQTKRIQEVVVVETEVKLQNTIEDLNLSGINERVANLEARGDLETSTAEIVVIKSSMGSLCTAFNQYNGDSPEHPGWGTVEASWVPMATPNREWTEEFQVDGTYRFIQLNFQRATITLKYPFYDRISEQALLVTAQHVPTMYYRIECISSEDRSSPDAIYYAGQRYTLRTVPGQLDQGSVSAHIPNPPKGAYRIKMWPSPFHLPTYLNPTATSGNRVDAIHFYGFQDPNGVFHRTLVSMYK